MDKYDKAIEFFTKYPNMICEKWSDPSSMHGCLFQFATPTGNMNGSSGCLTLIRKYDILFVPDRPDLTEEIRKDVRIPLFSDEIRVETLSVFAEWQRRLDKELKRV